MKDLEYEERAEKVMPKWSSWGYEIVEIKKRYWYESRNRIISILKQLHRAKKQAKRIKELEAALQEMVPFIEDDFPNGTGTNHGTCATDKYQQVCNVIIQILKRR